MKYLAFLPLFLCTALQALELGEAVVESVPGETLDASIPLLDSNAAGRGGLRLIRTDRAAYAEAGLDYTPLHARIVMELVFTAGQPQVAVSSIGPVHETAFSLLVGIVHANGRLLRPVRIALSAPPAPEAQVITPPEVLARLLALLAERSGQSRTDVFSELKRLVDGQRYPPGERRPVMRFLPTGIAPDFVDGVASLMSGEAAAAFDRRLGEGRPARALSEALFGDRQYEVLGGLLVAGTVSAMRNSENVSQRLASMREQIAALENRIAELGHTLERGRNETETPPRNRWWNVRSVLDEYGWDNRRLLTRPVWTGFAVFWGLLLLLMMWRQWRCLRAASPPAQPPFEPPSSAPTPLPGQRDLERLRATTGGGAADVRGAEGGDTDLAGKLHLAYGYIEIGESQKAAALLDEVIRSGDASQRERARELKGKLG